MNVNEMTFGVEFETTLPRDVIAVGSYGQGTQIPGLPEGWVAKHDGSIRASRNRMGAEIVSPILKGADGIRQLQAVCQWFQQVGAKVNRSTGFHVHVGWTGDATALERLVFLASNFEKALYASTGTKTRERNHYCRGVQNDPVYQARFVQGDQRQTAGRYYLLNLTNLGNGRKQTVEFRCFAGTTNLSKALGYVRMCLGLVEKALQAKRTTKWVAKKPVETSPIHRSGDGQTELTRLFYALGWTKGREKHTFGNVESDGLPTLKRIKKELMKLAKKYDSRQ